jgi:uncharacterized protein YbbK (DUF523 family)
MKPRIVVSRCLGFEAIRYNGEIIDVSWRERLEEMADVVTVCPEIMAGLGARIQDGTGTDYTSIIEKASDDFLSSLGNVEGFILKSKSPSCGLGTSKIHFGDSIYMSLGVFAKKAMEMYPEAVFTDESSINENEVEAFVMKL